MKRRLSALAVSASLVLGPAQALSSQQSIVAPSRDSQAVAVLQDALSALGCGPTVPTSVAASGTFTQFLADSATSSSPLRVEVLGVDQYRWEVDTPDQGTIVTVVSGTTSWQQSAQGINPIPVSQIPGNTFESFPALAIFSWLNSSAVGLKLIGTESLSGTAVSHLSIVPTLIGNTDTEREKRYEAILQRELFLDSKTNLPVRIRYYQHPTDWRAAIPIEVVYSNFQNIGGVVFPMTVTSYLGDNPITQIQYESIKLNVPVAASDFVGSAQ